MSNNTGKTDRSIRVILGLIIVILGFYFQSWWGLIGLLPLLTAAIGWCPAYSIFGISTCRIKQPGH
jgi:hypothetical protein